MEEAMDSENNTLANPGHMWGVQRGFNAVAINNGQGTLRVCHVSKKVQAKGRYGGSRKLFGDDKLTWTIPSVT